MKSLRWVPILSILGLAFALAGCAETMQTAAPGAGKTVLRIASPFKAGHILVDAAQKFKELVGQGSGGRLDVQIDAGTKSEEVINKANRTGEIEMQSNGTMFLQDYAPPYYFFTGPYVMKDFEHYMRAWNGKLGQAARAQLEKNDLKYLATIYRGLRQMTTKKPVYTPADVYGLKLRLPNVPTWLTVWKAMDASPIAVPLPELYNSLKTGRAESSEGDLPQISSFKLDEVQTHLIITNHLVQTGGILIHKPFFDRLSKADQDLIVKAAKETEEWANNKIKTGEAGILVDLQRKGMQVVIPDAESFRVKAKAAVVDVDDGHGFVQSGIWGDHWVVGRDVPMGEDFVVIHGDAEKLTQVLLNLVRNAIEAARESSQPEVVFETAVAPLRVRAASGRTRPLARLSVLDNGPGIPESMLPRLFTPFATSKAHGTGLGLAISRRIVEAHGGRIEVRNRAGGGAEAAVYLPLADS